MQIYFALQELSEEFSGPGIGFVRTLDRDKAHGALYGYVKYGEGIQKVRIRIAETIPKQTARPFTGTYFTRSLYARGLTPNSFFTYLVKNE